MKRNKRLYRGVCMLFLVFVLAPMEDGCKYEKAAVCAVHPARDETSLAKGNR